jgi:hypothetical protein
MLPVPSAVLAATNNLRTRQSMLLGSALEGGWGPTFNVGDQGTSFGPYQMHQGGLLTSLGLTPQQAENPSMATRAMLPVYEHAVNQISDQLWQTNPQQAAEQAARIAENPAQDYYSQGAPVTQDWANVTAVLQNQKSSGGMPVNATTTAAGGAGGNPLISGIFSQLMQLIGLGPVFGLLPASSGVTQGGILGALFGITDVKKSIERIGLVIFGAALVIVGIVILVMPAAKKGVQEAAAIRRGGTALTGGGGRPGVSPEETARKQAIANRSLDIGQQKVNLQRQREMRLTRGSSTA